MDDTAERRDATVRDLEGKGLNHEFVATRMRADVSQAKPATEAIIAGSEKTMHSKGRRHRGRAVQVERAGTDRLPQSAREALVNTTGIATAAGCDSF